MFQTALSVICPGGLEPGRLAATLEQALDGFPAEFSTLPYGMPREKRILFVISLDETGINPALYALVAALRRAPGLLDGCIAGILVDGAGALYTKTAARDLVLAANQAGCLFIGQPLVEATGNLKNFTIRARNADTTLEEAYCTAVRELAERILNFAPPHSRRPRLTVLHASSRTTSNTLALWGVLRERLDPVCTIREIGLRNGTLEDCAGCPYTACLHFGEKGECFYGGVMVKEVYPAVQSCDALIMLCPNYNDALSANLTACINRLTALYRAVSFDRKALFGVVVSGYSGGDLVAAQLVSALNMNKGFWLPPRFCMTETANDAGEAMRLDGIDKRLENFSDCIRSSLCIRL